MAILVKQLILNLIDAAGNAAINLRKLMVGRVLELSNIISPDLLATRLTERWVQWDTLRNVKKQIGKKYVDMSMLLIRL